MSAIVAGGSLELQDIANGYWFEISVGGLDGTFQVRGENVTLPGKTGQTYMTKVGSEWPVKLHGIVFGVTTTPRIDYLTKVTALKAIFSPDAEPFTVVLHPDARGVGGQVGAGQTATMTVEFLRFIGPPALGDEIRTLDIECRCISDPLGWTIA
jgi:hypothetical protein